MAGGNFSTHKEKWLAVTMIFFIICTFGLVITVIVLALPKEKPLSPEKPCLDEVCLKAAVNILDNMDKNVKPCNNFWKYSCGNFIKTHPVFSFEDKTKYSILTKMRKTVTSRLLLMLTEENTKDTISPVRKVKELFRTCMNQEMHGEYANQELMMRAIKFGGIPFITGNMNENLTRHQLLKNFTGFFSTNPFLHFDVFKNMFSGDGNMLVMAVQRPLTTEVITGTIEAVANKLNKSSIYNITEISSFMDAYQELSKTMPIISFEGIIHNKPQNISEISKSFSHFKMESFINGILSIGDTKLQDDSAIVIVHEESMLNLTRLISETTLESLLNIMSATLFRYIDASLTPSLKSTTLHGEHLNEKQTIGDMCFAVCSRLAPRVLGRMYVRKYFPEENRIKATYIAEYLGKALIEVLTKNTWLDRQSKNAVLNKAKELLKTKSIGFDPALISEEFLNKRYENVNVSNNVYFNIIEFNNALLRRTLKSYTDGITNDGIVMRSITVNAYYNIFHNTISVPAAIIQPPLFDMTISDAINFGSIGAIIGHEMMHAFDNRGIQLNALGNLQNILTNSSQVKFDERKTELINDYSDFKIPNINETVNGSMTVSESIADLSGVNIAYLAYQMWKRDHPELILPDIKMSSDQLFFTSFVQVWCENQSVQLLKHQLENDIHLPAQVRSTLTLQNLNSFSLAFSCRDNSPMNPPKKMEIW